mmetsp:Transcript_37518/g.67892  ORF Transcript_37518/g.67892 Transcript_37518/m.67892 type:complete len:340 (-) Transcript_37518:69-1088(-)
MGIGDYYDDPKKMDVESGLRGLGATTIGHADMDGMRQDEEPLLPVAKQSQEIFISFRKKSMTIILSQDVCILVIAFFFDRFVLLPASPWVAVVAWVIPFILVAILYKARKKEPLNQVLMGVFTLFVGVGFGVLRAPMEEYAEFAGRHEIHSPQCYAILGHIFCMATLTMIACSPSKTNGLMKLAPASAAVSMGSLLLGLAGYYIRYSYICPPMIAGLAIATNSICVAWIGFQMDRLAEKLQSEDYLSPAILIWYDILAVLGVLGCALATIGMAVLGAEAGAADAGACTCADCACFGGEGCAYGCYGFYCDCYYGSGTNSNTPQSPGQRQEDHPTQQHMG